MIQKPKTKQEIAKHFDVTTRTIDGWMRAGILPYWKIGHLVRFDLAAVEARLNAKNLRNGKQDDFSRN
jgi:excisionase family DNA binding protein